MSTELNTPVSEQKPVSEQEQLQLIDDLFIPKVETPADEPESERELEEGEIPEGESLEDTSKIDYELEVPIVNGEKLTVGALKDYYQANQKNQTDLLDRENSLMRQKQEIEHLSQYLGVVPPEVIQQAKAKMQETVKQEFQQMLDVIPTWKDAVEFNKGRDAIYDLAKNYGLERDIGQVVDHRVIKLLFDFSRLRGDIVAAKETVKPLRSANDPKGKVAKPLSSQEKQQQLFAKAKQGSNQDRLKAIDSLLQGN